MKRRNALAGLSALMTTSMAGCMGVLGEEEESEQSEDPDPKILDASVDIRNFRQTGELEKSLVVIENAGGLGEFVLRAESIGDNIPLESVEQTFSMEAGMSFQTGFDIVSNLRVREMRFTFEATEVDASDQLIVSPGATPDMIDR